MFASAFTRLNFTTAAVVAAIIGVLYVFRRLCEREVQEKKREAKAGLRVATLLQKKVREKLKRQRLIKPGIGTDEKSYMEPQCCDFTEPEAMIL